MYNNIKILKKILLTSILLLVLTSCFEVSQNKKITENKMQNKNYTEQFFSQI
jgi:hypothetical protein